MHTENTGRGREAQAPKVTIIVPARNEEGNIERCLRSLVAQKGVSFDVIVVDDGSTDRTRELAETFTRAADCPFLASNASLLGVRVIGANPLPEGWNGKSNACATGAESATGEWLLFTDADTEHLDLSLAHAVAEAEEHGAGLLSYSPEQVLTSLSQKAIMPLIFSDLARVYKPREVSDPKSEVAAANGQYLLIRRDVYDRVGGFPAIAGDMLEDVAMARRVKALPMKIWFRLGAGLVRTRMYRDWSEVQAGWTKNLALLFQRPGRLAAARLLEFLLLMLLPVFSALSAMARHEMVALVEAFFAATLWIEFLVRVSKSHSSAGATLLSVFGLPLYAALLLRSAAAVQQGRILWKGRQYASSGTAERSGQSNVADNATTTAAR